MRYMKRAWHMNRAREFVVCQIHAAELNQRYTLDALRISGFDVYADSAFLRRQRCSTKTYFWSALVPRDVRQR